MSETNDEAASLAGSWFGVVTDLQALGVVSGWPAPGARAVSITHAAA